MLGSKGYTTVNWDKFDESSDDEEPEAPEPPPPVVIVKPPPPKPQLRKADPRDRDNFRPIRGRELELAKQLSEPGEDESNGDMRYQQKVTHISSDDAWNRRHNHQWDNELRAGRFHGAQAISSGDLFEEQVSTLDYLTGKLNLVKQTVKEALQDTTE